MQLSLIHIFQDGVIKEIRAIAAGVGNVSFTNLAAGEYSVSIDYAPSQTGISPVVIDKLSVTAQAIGIAITKIVPGENKLTVSGTAKPNERITLSTVPEGDVYKRQLPFRSKSHGGYPEQRPNRPAHKLPERRSAAEPCPS